MPARRSVTRAEPRPVRADLERVAIRVEVLTNDVHATTLHVKNMAEVSADFLERVDARFDALGEAVARFGRQQASLRRVVEDGHAAFLSGVAQVISSRRMRSRRLQ